MNSTPHPNARGKLTWLVGLVALAVVLCIGLLLIVRGEDRASRSSVPSASNALASELRSEREPSTSSTNHELVSVAVAEGQPATKPRPEGIARASAVKAPHEVVVTTLDASSNPLAGVRLTVRSGGAAELSVRSDAQGKAVFPWAEPTLDLRAELDNYAASELHFPYSHPEQIRVVLQGESMIRGRVRFTDGKSAGPGIRVLALPVTSTLSLDQAAIDSVTKSRHLHEAQTDDAGRFRIGGLTRNRSHRLVAGGAGLIMDEPLAGVVPSEMEVELIVEPGYACALKVVDDSGAPVEFSGLQVQGGCSVLSEDHSRLAFNALPSAILAGLSLDLADRRYGTPKVFLGPERPARVGPIRVTWNVPGYSAVDAIVNAESIATGGSVEVIECRRTSQGFGTVRVRIKNAPADIDDEWLRSHQAFEGQRGFCASLLLAHSGEEPWRFLLHPRSNDDWIAQNVPTGTYKARIQSRDEMFIYPRLTEPALDLTVGAETATLDLDLGHASAVEMRLRAESGGSFSGRVVVSIKGPTSRDSQMLTFERPPYTFPFIEPGAYSIWVVTPGVFLSRSGRQAETLDLVAGQRTTFELSEARK